MEETHWGPLKGKYIPYTSPTSWALVPSSPHRLAEVSVFGLFLIPTWAKRWKTDTTKLKWGQLLF